MAQFFVLIGLLCTACDPRLEEELIEGAEILIDKEVERDLYRRQQALEPVP